MKRRSADRPVAEPAEVKKTFTADIPLEVLAFIQNQWKQLDALPAWGVIDDRASVVDYGPCYAQSLSPDRRFFAQISAGSSRKTVVENIVPKEGEPEILELSCVRKPDGIAVSSAGEHESFLLALTIAKTLGIYRGFFQHQLLQQMRFIQMREAAVSGLSISPDCQSVAVATLPSFISVFSIEDGSQKLQEDLGGPATDITFVTNNRLHALVDTGSYSRMKSVILSL